MASGERRKFIGKATAEEANSFVGLERELIVNQANGSIHVHDGSTAGGSELACADLSNVKTTTITNKISATIDRITVNEADIDALQADSLYWNNIGTISKSANYTIASGDEGSLILFNGTSLTATFPSDSSMAGKIVLVNNKNASALTIGGVTNLATLVRYQTALVVCDSAGVWRACGIPGTSSIVEAYLAPSSVTTTKIADANVTNAKLANNAVTAVKITDGTITTAKLSWTPPFTKMYESSAFPIPTSSSVVELTHGLGTMPKMACYELVCTTADLGYSVGDRVLFTQNQLTDAASRGSTLSYTSTKIWWAHAHSCSGFAIARKDTGVNASITVTSWDVVVRAWA